jgi:hypothetical protein
MWRPIVKMESLAKHNTHIYAANPRGQCTMNEHKHTGYGREAYRPDQKRSEPRKLTSSWRSWGRQTSSTCSIDKRTWCYIFLARSSRLRLLCPIPRGELFSVTSCPSPGPPWTLLEVLGPTDVFDMLYRQTDVVLHALTKVLPTRERGEILVRALSAPGPPGACQFSWLAPLD